jgi:predicted DNA-binding transcriptional regulator YafY
MRADRLLEIILLLQTRGKMTAKSLAIELEVSRRTVLRDIDALSFAGIPIYAEGGHGGGIALDENYRTSLTGLREIEAFALFINSNTKLLGDIGLGDAAETSFLKLFASLPAAHKPSVESMRQRFLIDPDWWWHETQPSPNWDQLEQAVYEDRYIQVHYEKFSGEVVERTLQPYSLIAKSSLWYLIAKHDDDFRIYRVSRFHTITLLDKHFNRQPDFDLPTFWNTHLHDFIDNIPQFTFTIRIHASRIRLAQRLVPGRSQILQPEDPDGWMIAQFQIESIELATMLVVGLGDQASIIDPPELHTAVLNTARQILETYSQD